LEVKREGVWLVKEGAQLGSIWEKKERDKE
jgi:hypothetical protein